MPEQIDYNFFNKFVNELTSDYHIYLSLDLAFDENKARLFELEPEPDWEPLLLHTDYEDLINDGPVFVETSIKSPLLKWFLEKDEGRSAFLFFSKFKLSEVSEHFRRFLHIKFFSDQKIAFFRYYDPRNLGVFLQSLTPGEKLTFMGPIETMVWRPEELPQNERSWLLIKNETPQKLPQFTPPWLQSAATETAFIDKIKKGQPKQLVKDLNYNLENERELRCLGKISSFNFAQDAIENAHSKGLTNSNDMAIWAAFMIKYGHNFYDDPLYSWAGLKPKNETPEEMIERLELMSEEFEMASVYGVDLNNMQTIGDSWEMAASFWRRLWLLRYNDLALLNSKESLEYVMEKLHPERFQAIEKEGLKQHFDNAEKMANDYGLPEAEGRAILSAVTWLCGSGAWNNDPAKPWLTKIVDSTRELPPSERASWLFNRLKRRINYKYRRYRLTEHENQSRAQRLHFREISRRFKLFDLKDGQRPSIETSELATGFINYVGQEYSPKISDELHKACLDKALIEGDLSRTAEYFKGLKPLFMCFLYYVLIVSGNVPSESLDSRREPVDWLFTIELEGLTNDEARLAYLREALDNELNANFNYSLFDKKTIERDSADDDLFKELR